MGLKKKIEVKKYFELLGKTCSNNVVLLCICVIAVIGFILLKQVKASQYLIISLLVYIVVYFGRLLAFEHFKKY